MATYVNDLRLKEIATGDEAGTWGASTNTNLELIAEAFSFGTEAITTNADTHTTTIADGSTDPGRSLFLKYTGTLDSACTITIGPNTVSKLWLIQNSTSGSQNIIIKQGSGATVTVPNGQTKAIYSDGAGSGGAMVDAFAHLNVVDLTVEDDLTITDDLTVNGDLDLEGSIDVNGTTNLDVVDIDGALTQDGGAVFNEASADVDFRIESNGQENMFFVDGGDDAVVIGNNSSRKTLFNTTATAAFQIEGTSGNTAAMSIARNSNDDNGPQFVLAKSNGTSAGAVTVVTDDALLGRISFQGADGTQTVEGARVEAFVDGTPGADDMPGRLVFSTTADGASSPTERLRITSVGDTQARRARSNTAGEVALSVQPSDSTIHYGFRIDSSTNSFNLDRVDSAGNLLAVTSSGNATFSGSVTAAGLTVNGTALVNDDLSVQGAAPTFQLYDTSVTNNITKFEYDETFLIDIDKNNARGSTALQIKMDGTEAFSINSSRNATFSGAITSGGNITVGGTNNLIINDSGALVIGAQNDVLISNTGSVFNEDGQDADFRVESDGNANMLFVDAGSNHVNIGTATDHGGTLNVQTTDNSVNLVLACTDTDGSEGPILDLTRDAGNVPSDGDVMGVIRFRNDNADLVMHNYAQIEARAVDVSSGTEDGRLEIATVVAGTQGTSRALFNSGETVFNDNSADLDFRVESDNQANMFGVNAGSDFVYVGTDEQAQGGALNVNAVSASASLSLFTRSATDAHTNILNFMKTPATSGNYTATSSGDVLGDIRFTGVNTSAVADIGAQILATQNGTSSSTVPTALKFISTEIEHLKLDGSVVFNEDGVDLDFRIESDSNANMLLVDAGNNNVTVGHSSAGGATFAISDSGNATIQFFPEISTDTNLIQHYDLTAAAYMNAETRAASHSFKIGTAEKVSIDSAGAVNFAGNVFLSDVIASGSGGLSFQTDEGTKRIIIADSGDVTINDTGVAVDFRVESDDQAYAFLVDGANDAVCIGKSTDSLTSAGSSFSNLQSGGHHYFAAVNTETTDTNSPVYINRQTSDGHLIQFRQANNNEGNISVSGSTVSLNGFAGRHESSGIATDTVKGTVVSTIDELDVYSDTQLNPETGQQESSPKAGQSRTDHAKVKISDSVADKRVYGVVGEINAEGKVFVNSLGIGSIKVTGACAGGDLLESNGDGTAKVQSDDIIRSSTIGKVTIGNSDTGVKLVSCVLYCG